MNISRAIIRWAVAAVLLLGVVLLVRSCRSPAPPPVVLPDTATAAAYQSRIAQLEGELEAATGESDGLRGVVEDLRNRLRGIEERTAGRVTVYDTVVTFETDTLQLAWSIEGGTLGIVGAVPVAGGHQPVELQEIDVGDCDDGIRTVGLRVICDRPRFGHLSLIARGVLGAAPAWPLDSLTWRGEAGLRWTPSFRSSSALELVGTSEMGAELRGEVGVRVW